MAIAYSVVMVIDGCHRNNVPGCRQPEGPYLAIAVKYLLYITIREILSYHATMHTITHTYESASVTGVSG